jgi:hypothetical protein
MRKTIAVALAMVTAAVSLPAVAHLISKPANDPLGDTLRGYGFVPINPPSNLMSVGSLYYVDAAVKDFKAICHPTKADLDGVVVTSRSWEMEEDLEHNGRFATDMKIDIGPSFAGSLDQGSVQKVHVSLTDVMLEEIPLGTNWMIFAKLMEKPECSEVAKQYIRVGGYVCQGQKILQATAEFKLNRDAQSEIATDAKADDLKALVKHAIEAQGDQSVVERDGRLFAGAALNYGVSMNPVCLAPPDGRFERVLPRTTLGRAINFVLFDIIEPILPAKSGRSEVAQNARGET